MYQPLHSPLRWKWCVASALPDSARSAGSCQKILLLIHSEISANQISHHLNRKDTMNAFKYPGVTCIYHRNYNYNKKKKYNQVGKAHSFNLKVSIFIIVLVILLTKYLDRLSTNMLQTFPFIHAALTQLTTWGSYIPPKIKSITKL